MQNMTSCSGEEVVAGLATSLYHIPAAHMGTYTKPPKQPKTYEEASTIPSTGLVPLPSFGWKKIDVLVDKNKLTNLLSGTKGNMKCKVDLDIFIKGFGKKTVGFQKVHANTPMIYGIPDSTGQMWIIGNKENGAYFTSSENTSGDTGEADSGITGKITANTSVLAYDGELTLLPDSPLTP
ncbi:hypothetical protein [Chryseobacterium sp.]|uniref:hypothetical protein n=1 Tax=Chryseobacterium sp. TaxID=1871047 RepID=UPI002631315C|nr:hypothetical protein [Chryseobacterium sp.]